MVIKDAGRTARKYARKAFYHANQVRIEIQSRFSIQ